DHHEGTAGPDAAAHRREHPAGSDLVVDGIECGHHVEVGVSGQIGDVADLEADVRELVGGRLTSSGVDGVGRDVVAHERGCGERLAEQVDDVAAATPDVGDR